MYLGHFFPPVYLLLCVITDLLFVICNLALRGAADAAGVQLAASQRSGFSDFLFRAAAESQERITFSSEKFLFFQLPSLLVHFSTHVFWIRGWKWRAPNPKAAARRSPACPSYWHLVLLYQLLIEQCSRTVCAN